MDVPESYNLSTQLPVSVGAQRGLGEGDACQILQNESDVIHVKNPGGLWGSLTREASSPPAVPALHSASGA